MSAIDTNSNVAGHVTLLKSKGVTHVGRYYSSSQRKRLTPQEALAISNAGLKIFVVFENGGSPNLTFEQGVHDAQIAVLQAKAAKQPQQSAIYFALEGLPHGYGEDDLAGAKTYMAGVNSVLGGAYKAGVYADGLICRGLLDAGLVAYTWLSASSSFPGTRDFAASNLWSIKQDPHVDQNWDGLSIDTNLIKAEIGAFSVALAVADDAASAPGALAASLQTAAFISAPIAANRYTVKTNHRYQATVTLGLLEVLASNDQVAQFFVGLGFSHVVANGLGIKRTVQGTWLGSDTTVDDDPRLSDIVDLGPIAPGN